MVALVFTGVSLRFLGRHPPREPPAPGPPRAAVPAASTNGAPLQLAAATDADGALVFVLPYRDEIRARPGTLHLHLRHAAAPAPCTIQVAVESDHHGSFGHLHQPAAVPEAGFAFQAPLGGSTDYWQPLDHAATWSAWERHGLRRLEVKVFDLPPRTAVRLLATFVPDPEPAAPSLAWARPLADPVALGERWELAFDLDGLVANPFDETATGLRLLVTPPDGREAAILPFLYQNFETFLVPGGEKIRPKGAKQFRARYRPTATGTHHYRLVREAGEGAAGQLLASGSFEVLPGRLPPFIRISPRNPRYFETLDGRFFYPIGWNIAFPCDTPYGIAYLPYLPAGQSLATMRKMLEDLAASGGNCIRLWQSTWWNALEWGEGVDNYGGAGRYNLKNAWITDQVLDTCGRLGIHALFTMQNHTRFFPQEWPQHPLNRRNGGFLRYSDEFWLEPRAVPSTQRQLAYAIARFADSPACFSWDFVSEVDNIARRDNWRRVRNRALDYLQYMKALDPYGRLVANHVCILNSDFRFFDEPLLEFIQSNAYSGLSGLSEDQLFGIRDYSVRFADKTKPVLVSECGGHWAGDPAGKMRRDTFGAVWAGVASRLSGVPQSWWWNFNYGENLGRGYRIVADFMAGEDLIAEDTPEAGGWRNREARCESAGGNLRALMVGNDARRFLFLFNFDTACRTRLIPSRCTSNTVAFAEMRPGRYVAEYWDPKAGPAGRREPVVVDEQGQGLLRPPAFSESWMVKLVRDTAETSAAASAPEPALPDPGSAAPAPGTPPGPAEDAPPLSLAWEIEPLLPVRAEAAAGRAYVEAHLALPAEGRGRFPAVTDAAGAPVPCGWEWLEDQRGWRLRIPGTATGPFKVAAVSRPPADAWTFDPQAAGLEVEVVPWHGGGLPTPERFEQAFAAAGAGRRTRVAAVDQLENPLGDNDFFLAVYRGPLAVPVDGVYRLALNSDDGGFLKLDGRVIVSWPGPHDMEKVNSPLSNTWSHDAEIELERGLHWIECYHQEERGAQLARAGWRLERA
ncbi:MAG: hypothetical protein GX571_04020, partial [Lentisphaerae bacterium]|nr:hypothetical protein [Lentisphaerota bacterium]